MSVLDSTLTVASLRPLYQCWTDPVAFNAKQFNATAAPNFIPRLNECCDQLNDEGLWKGVTGEVWFNGTTTGYITLPRRYYAIFGANIGGVPRNTFTQFNQYKDLGLGWRPASQYTQYGLTDDGDGHCTLLDLDYSSPSTLAIQITNAADAGKTIRFRGTDQDGNDIYDLSGGAGTGAQGLPVTTVFPSVSTTQIFSELTNIQVGISSTQYFLYPWTLWATVGGVNTQIGYYEPGEQYPSYRRYKTGVITPSTDSDCAQNVIRAYCTRRIIPLIYETDLVFPDASRAIGLGLQALWQEKNVGDTNKSQDYWQAAIHSLNKKIESARGRVNLTMPFGPANPPSMPFWCH